MYIHTCVPSCIHTLHVSADLQPMKVQKDSFEERSQSPGLPEPLYEEVGDFGLQVLKSLETSFLSSSTAETQEVPDLRLVPMETGHSSRTIIPEVAQTAGAMVDSLDQSRGGGGGTGADCSSAAGRRKEQLQGVCTPSQELLLQELSSAFTRKEEEVEEDDV